MFFNNNDDAKSGNESNEAHKDYTIIYESLFLLEIDRQASTSTTALVTVEV